MGGSFSSGIITGSLNKLMKGLKEIDNDTSNATENSHSMIKE